MLKFYCPQCRLPGHHVIQRRLEGNFVVLVCNRCQAEISPGMKIANETVDRPDTGDELVNTRERLMEAYDLIGNLLDEIKTLKEQK